MSKIYKLQLLLSKPHSLIALNYILDFYQNYKKIWLLKYIYISLQNDFFNKQVIKVFRIMSKIYKFKYHFPITTLMFVK